MVRACVYAFLHHKIPKRSGHVSCIFRHMHIIRQANHVPMTPYIPMGVKQSHLTGPRRCLPAIGSWSTTASAFHTVYKVDRIPFFYYFAHCAFCFSAQSNAVSFHEFANIIFLFQTMSMYSGIQSLRSFGSVPRRRGCWLRKNSPRYW